MPKGFWQRIGWGWAIVGCLMPSAPLLAQSSPREPLLDRGQNGMVAAAHPLATQAGVSVLQQGGNAVDAAVATTFALSVVEPFSAGIGGGGFLLLREANTGEIRALDFRERAPLSATRTLYLDAQGNPRPRSSIDGHLAVATPGTVAGLAEVHRRYGRLPWKAVVAPAIQLAATGFPVSWRFVEATESRKAALLANPDARRIFTRNGTLYTAGDILVQSDLAATLQAIAQDPTDFYTGRIASAIANDMAANGGLITVADLKRYRPRWRDPVCGEFRQARICSMPPPSSGGVHLLQILNLMSDPNFSALGWRNPDVIHVIAEAMRIAYADRAEHLGDPDFVDVPVAGLISPGYARYRRSQIQSHVATPSSQVRAIDRSVLQRLLSGKHSAVPLRSPQPITQHRESEDTSHLTVVDRDRTAVSLTFTVNLGFGSGVVAQGTGILLNNEMDDFAIAPDTPNAFGLVGRDANAIAPGKTPLSSMTPTIVTQQGKLRLALGSPGGSTIITTVLQIILNVLVYDMDIRRAVAAPRFHHQWLPDRLLVERWGLDALTLTDLRRRGHQIVERSQWGNATAIEVLPDGSLAGAADPRGEGTAIGY